MVKIQSISKQHGMTTISFLFLAVAAIMIILFLIRLVPLYIDSASVESAVQSMASDVKMKTAGTKALKKSLLTKFNLNSVYSVTGDDIYISKPNGKTLIEVEYEIRENLVGNLDFVVSFKSDVTLP